jgi:hypothetical protein
MKQPSLSNDNKEPNKKTDHTIGENQTKENIISSIGCRQTSLAEIEAEKKQQC